MTLRRVVVSLGERSYPVVIGAGARNEAGRHVPASARRIAVISQHNVPTSLIPEFAGVDTRVFHIGHGEEHKSLTTIEQLCSGFAQFGMTRNDLVVGVGGGMVTDVAGFAAASFHRGIPVMHVATTLLGMVDAAIGGKTGVNIPEGKNLVGAFWQPCAVICDTDALTTLSDRETRCGNGEMSKYHFIAREDMSALSLQDRIARSVEIKGEIVASDERESGRRALLNYGHTLAHALEVLTEWKMAHGEAVSLGLLYAAHLAHVMGRIDKARVEEHYRVVHDVYGLALPMPDAPDTRFVEVMARDKKALESLTFVLDSDRGLEVVNGVSKEHVEVALEMLRGRVGVTNYGTKP
jgi:5-deoxy-5-amino-3-dehydroquinate synthase